MASLNLASLCLNQTHLTSRSQQGILNWTCALWGFFLPKGHAIHGKGRNQKLTPTQLQMVNIFSRQLQRKSDHYKERQRCNERFPPIALTQSRKQCYVFLFSYHQKPTNSYDAISTIMILFLLLSVYCFNFENHVYCWNCLLQIITSGCQSTLQLFVHQTSSLHPPML